MSQIIKKGILIATLAGILLSPACSSLSKNAVTKPSDSIGSTTLAPSGQAPSSTPAQTLAPTESQPSTTSGGVSAAKPEEDGVKVITSENELEEYFNSISDEEIEELFRIIEESDIKDIDIETDPGFEDIVIP